MGLWILNKLHRRNKFLYGFADQKVKIIRIFMMNILWINRRHLLWKKVMLFLALLPKTFGFCLELFSSYLFKTLVVIFLMLSLIELIFFNVPSVLHSWNKYHAVMVFIHVLLDSICLNFVKNGTVGVVFYAILTSCFRTSVTPVSQTTFEMLFLFNFKFL